MSTPPRTSLRLPHRVDWLVLDEDYERLPRFLQDVEKVREREWGHGNGEFFHIVADQWMELASLQYAFLQPPAKIVESAKRGLKDFVLGLELGHPIEALTALEYFSAAMAVNDRPCAHVIASAPGDVLGLDNDPDDPLPDLTRAAFALLLNRDSELQAELEILQGLLLEHPLDKAYYPMKTEMVNLYNLFASIQKKDEAEFNKRLLERCQIRLDISNQEESENEPPAVIDWTALGLVCFARDRGLKVSVQHVYIPLQIVETARLTQQQSPRHGAGAGITTRGS